MTRLQPRETSADFRNLPKRHDKTQWILNHHPNSWFYDAKKKRISCRFEHLSPRESSAIVFYRYTLRMSISHIATLTERSTRTVHRLLSKNSWTHKLYDKRKVHPHARRMGEWHFRRVYAALSWFYELWKEGQIGNIHLLTGVSILEGKPP